MPPTSPQLSHHGPKLSLDDPYTIFDRNGILRWIDRRGMNSWGWRILWYNEQRRLEVHGYRPQHHQLPECGPPRYCHILVEPLRGGAERILILGRLPSSKPHLICIEKVLCRMYCPTCDPVYPCMLILKTYIRYTLHFTTSQALLFSNLVNIASSDPNKAPQVL